jgi:hypothetical protein
MTILRHVEPQCSGMSKLSVAAVRRVSRVAELPPHPRYRTFSDARKVRPFGRQRILRGGTVCLMPHAKAHNTFT